MFIWKDQFEALVAERDRLFSQYVGERNVSAALRKTNESLAEVNRGLVHQKQALVEQLRTSEAKTNKPTNAGKLMISTVAPLLGTIKPPKKSKKRGK